jgi:hypothetical protein
VEGLKRDLVEAYAADVDRVFAAAGEAFGSGGPLGRALEVLEPLAQLAGAAASAGLLGAVVGVAAGGEPAGAACPGCGAAARVVAVRPKTVATLSGEVSYGRRYFHCAGCGGGFAPFDAALGVEGKMSAGMSKAAALAGAEMPYARAAKLIEVFAGRPVVSASTVNRAAVAQGRKAQAAIDAEARCAKAAGFDPGLPDPPPDKVYLLMDGTGAPMLPSEVNPDSGKAPDGRAKTREVKIGVVFTSPGAARTGNPPRTPAPNRMWRHSTAATSSRPGCGTRPAGAAPG